MSQVAMEFLLNGTCCYDILVEWNLLLRNSYEFKRREMWEMLKCCDLTWFVMHCRHVLDELCLNGYCSCYFSFVNDEMMKNKKNIYVIKWSLFYYKMVE